METNIELKGELGIVDSRPPTEEIKPPPWRKSAINRGE